MRERQQKRAGAAVHRPPLLRLYCLLTALLALVSAVLLILDVVIAYSVLLGGLIALLPGAWFAWQYFRYSGARQMVAVAHSLYRGEAGKFALTVVLFATVFAIVQPLRAGELFAAYMAMMLLQTVMVARLR